MAWALLIAAGLILWHLPALTLIPSVNHDEIMLNAAARSWTARGLIALTPLVDIGKTYGTAYYWHPPGHLLAMALAYKLFGFSIAVTRGVSLAGGASAAALLFLVFRKLAVSRLLATILTLLFVSHPLVWWLCRSGRMDLIAMSFGLAALLVVAGKKAQEATISEWVLAGLLIGSGSLFHVMILVWAPALAAAECFQAKRIHWKALVALGLTAGLPLICWVISILAIGDREAWMEQFVGYALRLRTGNADFLLQFLGELRLIFVQLEFVPGLLLLLAAGLIAGWGRTDAARRWCLGGAVVSFLLITFGTAKGTGAYPLYWFVWALLLAAPGIETLPAKLNWSLIAIAMANVAVVHCAQVGVALYQRAARNPERIERFFAKEIPRGSIVMGPEEIWYAVEKSGSELRIWADENSFRHDYYVTSASIPARPPPGFRLLAELPDTMPKVLGRYCSNTSFSYRIWVRKNPP